MEDEALKFICQQGYDPSYGARHLRRAIENLVVDPISDMLLKGGLTEGKGVNVHLRDGKLEFDIVGIMEDRGERKTR